MALSKKIINKVLDDFKKTQFINSALSQNNVEAFDFFDFIENNKDYKALYEKIQNINQKILEDQIAQEVYKNGRNDKILLEMIKANNQNKYNFNKKIEVTNNIQSMTDEELTNEILKYKNLI